MKTVLDTSFIINSLKPGFNSELLETGLVVDFIYEELLKKSEEFKIKNIQQLKLKIMKTELKPEDNDLGLIDYAKKNGMKIASDDFGLIKKAKLKNLKVIYHNKNGVLKEE